MSNVKYLRITEKESGRIRLLKTSQIDQIISLNGETFVTFTQPYRRDFAVVDDIDQLAKELNK